ncbi:MAG: GNAT family N-acetyltransferase [Xenococcaceae cyanobacterium MO_188.B32]|nr:GNAT family N-acetyltransferase [Xenococcaceae cyanobacterium MO_188.B32]
MILVEPCSIQHLEMLLAGKKRFFDEFGIYVGDDYELMPQLLQFSLNSLKKGTISPRWLTHMLIVNEPRIMVGIVGYKGNPDDRGVVEIGYSIAASYQGKGLATQAARILLDRAFATGQVKVVRAHTLPKENPSTSVLKKVGMTFVGEFEDEEDGKVWRWECTYLPPNSQTAS